MPADTLSVTDNRTGREFEIVDAAVHATELRRSKVDESDFAVMSYDPRS